MNKYKAWRLWLLKSIQLQLFISLISLPFLIAWGLPLSLVSPISTMLFIPFVTGFLLISSLIFFLELLHLPNSIPIWLLEKVVTLWFWFLQWGHSSWLIGFKKPSTTVLVAIVIITIAILHNKKIAGLYQRIVFLALLLIGICAALTYFSPTQKIQELIPCNKGNLSLLVAQNCIILIDPGHIGSRPSYESWISFSFIPELIKKTGQMSIDHLILFKINQRTFDAIRFLGTKITIKNLYIPWWTGKIPSFAWKSYVKLKKTVTLSQGKIHSVSKQKHILQTTNCTLFIEPKKTKEVHYYDATYPSLQVAGCLYDENVTI